MTEVRSFSVSAEVAAILDKIPKKKRSKMICAALKSYDADIIFPEIELILHWFKKNPGNEGIFIEVVSRYVKMIEARNK